MHPPSALLRALFVVVFLGSSGTRAAVVPDFRGEFSQGNLCLGLLATADTPKAAPSDLAYRSLLDWREVHGLDSRPAHTSYASLLLHGQRTFPRALAGRMRALELDSIQASDRPGLRIVRGFAPFADKEAAAFAEAWQLSLTDYALTDQRCATMASNAALVTLTLNFFPAVATCVLGVGAAALRGPFPSLSPLWEAIAQTSFFLISGLALEPILKASMPSDVDPALHRALFQRGDEGPFAEHPVGYWGFSATIPTRALQEVKDPNTRREAHLDHEVSTSLPLWTGNNFLPWLGPRQTVYVDVFWSRHLRTPGVAYFVRIFDEPQRSRGSRIALPAWWFPRRPVLVPRAIPVRPDGSR